MRHLITIPLILFLSVNAHAQPVHIPDPNLRAAVKEALNIPTGAQIAEAVMLKLVDLNARNWRGIENLSGLEYATNLRFLRVEGGNITDINPLTDLRLEELWLSSNQVTDLSPISGMTSLTQLGLRSNRISDISVLANLTNLVWLELHKNSIVDHSPLDGLSLEHLTFDQICDMPPLPLKPRLERSFPSIFSAFGGDTIINQPHLPDLERRSQHDLNFCCLMFGGTFVETENGVVIHSYMEEAIQRRDDLIAQNPNRISLAAFRWLLVNLNTYPPDSPYWIRDANGDIAMAHNSGTVDITHPDVQREIIGKAVAIDKCGLYDGLFFDFWGEYAQSPANVEAMVEIVKGIREVTRENFLIIGNSNEMPAPETGPYLNGLFMETQMPSIDYEHGGDQQIETSLIQIERTLRWGAENLRPPHIICLEGAGFTDNGEPLDSPRNLRWMRAITALSLTFSDGYILYITRFLDGVHQHWHYWYDFWDADLGRSEGEKFTLYDAIQGLYIREYTNGWAVYNHSGATQVITLPELVGGVASGLLNTEHALPNLDGEIYLKKTVPIDTPDVNGSDIFIAEPIYAVPGAVLLLDASNNPETTAHWVNLGTAGGRLQASEILARRPRVEDGEIEIPSIGFSGRRKYYTATASRHTFGGPVHTNPQLYLGDWTLEFLCKRNGNLFTQEHQFAGFQNSPREGLQGIRLWLPNDGRELSMSIHAEGSKQPERALNIFLEENVWTWVTVVSINGESIIAYQDGVEVSRHPGVHFDASVPLNDISIGANSFDERHRNFNGSFSIVRVYDRALGPDEVLQNIGATVIPVTNPADVNKDGVVNILDLVAVAQAFGKDGLQADVNGDGVVNVFDLVQVAGAIGGDAAAPSADSPELSIISAADVERWLALAQGLDLGDANFQRGIHFLEGLLAALTPKETMLLPNYPNPFNPETWIPYHLARGAEVAITIYDTKGTLVRRLALGNQSAGYYAERGKAAYWDGRNEDGEAVASGIYIYQFRAGDYAASRRMVIVK